MVGCLSAKVKSEVTAIPVTVAYSSGLPDEVGFMDRPFGYKKGLKVTFFLQGENMTSIDRSSFKAEGWVMHHVNNISKDGKRVSLIVYNASFKDNLNDVKLSATVDVMVGSKTKRRKIKFKKGAKPVKFPSFTAEYNSSGVKVVGDFKYIKSVSLLRDGKEVLSSGYSSIGKQKTFMLDGIKESDEVSVIYWTDLEAKSVKLVK